MTKDSTKDFNVFAAMILVLALCLCMAFIGGQNNQSSQPLTAAQPANGLTTARPLVVTAEQYKNMTVSVPGTGSGVGFSVVS